MTVPLIKQLVEHTLMGGGNPIVSIFRYQNTYEIPVYKKISTRSSKKETFETTKGTIYFTIIGIWIILLAIFEIS